MDSKISLSPFSSLPKGISRFYQDHAQFFSENNSQVLTDASIFHTDYFWLGSGRRCVMIKLKVADFITDEKNIIQLRVHSYPTHDSANLNCIYEKDITISYNSEIEERIDFITDESFNYAILCNLISGTISFSSVSIESYYVKEELDKSSSQLELRELSVL